VNVWQMTRQLQYILEGKLWPGGAFKVFKVVRISVAPDDELQNKERFPFVAIRPMGAQADPNQSEEPRLLVQNYAMRVFVAQDGDDVAESAIIGAHRAGGALSSRGKGLLEVEEQLIDAVGLVTGANGAKILNSLRSAVDMIREDDRPHIVLRDYLFEAVVGNARFYHPGTRLAATAPGGGVVSLTWKLPPTRFDFVRMRLRRAVGSTPPSSPTDGTDVTLAAPATDTSKTDTPGAGTFSYALFALYDDLHNTPTAELTASASDTVTIVAT